MSLTQADPGVRSRRWFVLRRLFAVGWIPLLALGLAWVLSQTPPFRLLDARLLDAQAALVARQQAFPGVLLVDIDDASLSTMHNLLGSWPYTRDKYALALDYLDELGARAVVLDIVLSERRDGDERLQQVIGSHGGVVLAASARDEPGSGEPVSQALRGLAWAVPPALPAPNWRDAELPLSRFTQATAGAAHIGLVSAVADDTDGMLRRLPLFYRIEGQVLPTLPLAALFAGDSVQPSVHWDGEHVRIGPYDLPVDAQGAIHLNYSRNAGAVIERLPFARLAGAMLGVPGQTIDPSLVKGRIVFIGSSAFLSDRVNTPAGELTGSYLLALVTEMIATGQLRVPPHTAWTSLLLSMALLPTLALLVWPHLYGRRIAIASIAAMAGLWLLHLGLLDELHQESSLLSPLLVAVLAWALISLRGLWMMRARQEAQIDAAVRMDALTGLPNRVAFQERLHRTVTTAADKQWPLSLVVLGLDHFKAINDSLGHAAGDQLLRGVAQRLGAQAGWARLGGDEYALIVDERASHALESARLILQAFKAPFTLAGSAVHVTASIGISHHPQHGADEITLLQNADAALHEAKLSGRSIVREFVAELGQTIKAQLRLQSELHDAISKGELVLFCQPQLDIASGLITAVEFLIRWHHPSRGLLLPSQFIPLAERSSLILEVDEWVLRTACRHLKAWQDAGLTHLSLGAVNLSARQFEQSNLPAQVERVLAESGLTPRCLELEITESLAMQNPEHTVNTLRALAQMGVTLAVDDFGTGHSSLAYLQRFPLDIVKIDRTFVCDIESSPQDAELCAAVIDLARRLGFATIAEGVETPGQLRQLFKFGCGKAQGYLIGRPMPAEALAEFRLDPSMSAAL